MTSQRSEHRQRMTETKNVLKNGAFVRIMLTLNRQHNERTNITKTFCLWNFSQTFFLKFARPLNRMHFSHNLRVHSKMLKTLN